LGFRIPEEGIFNAEYAESAEKFYRDTRINRDKNLNNNNRELTRTNTKEN
jgi:hypothetical protein